jgi:hypothetical protein
MINFSQQRRVNMCFDIEICIECKSNNIHVLTRYKTKSNGIRKLYICSACKKVFSETKNTFMENIKTPISKIATVLEVRTEGVAFNASCRIFKVYSSTLSNWERKFSELKEPLFLYSLTHTFIEQLIEGDELYTKVKSNKPASESEGWTIMLLERRSRFIWELSCSERTEKLFYKAIETLTKVIEKTHDTALLTDGERRYGNLLFDICKELYNDGKRGRPKSVLPEGVKVKLKNKGSQKSKRGPKRQKYQTPVPEHPGTKQNIANSDIHANHCEGQNAALRRKNSAYRRRKNTYAKENERLQITLDDYWIVHNFIRVHHTIKKIPAVAMGIIDIAIGWTGILKLRIC